MPPKIESFAFPFDGLPEGARTRVICGVTHGDPPLTIRWLKDGKPLSPRFPVNVSDLDSFSSLLSINSVSAAHSGEYTCVASNTAAQARYSSKLQVKGNLNRLPPSYTLVFSQASYMSTSYYSFEQDSWMIDNENYVYCTYL